MDSFAYKLIKEKKIKFKGGNFFLLNFPNNLLTLPNITTFFHILDIKYGEEADKIIRETAKRQIKAITNVLFEPKNLNSEKMALLLDYLMLFGYGKIKIADVNNSLKRIVFQIKNSTLCRMHSKLFGAKQHGGNAFLEGICSGIAEMIFDCNMDARETDCISMHKECCYILANESSEKENNKVLDKYGIDILKTLKEQNLPNTQAELIRKVEGHNMIDWTDGEFTLWGCSAFMLPTASLIFLTKALEEKFGKEINNLFYHLARIQSREAVYFQVKRFGFKKDKNLLMSILEHSNITGFGVSKLFEVDFKKQVLSSKQFYNPYPFYVRELLGKTDLAIDYYMGGLAAGVAEGFFGEPMESVETSCVAKGDEYCFHKAAKKGSETNYPLDEKYLKIIEEKINPKNFVL